jgi:hypothetical protein
MAVRKAGDNGKVSVALALQPAASTAFRRSRLAASLHWNFRAPWVTWRLILRPQISSLSCEDFCAIKAYRH